MNEHEGVRRVVYGEGGGGGPGDGATFIPVCEQCGRFVKADQEITFDGSGQPKGPNATCWKHGRVKMIFEGYV